MNTNRERAIQIALHHFKKVRRKSDPAAAIVSAVLALDPDALGGDVTLLMNVLPTEDELKQCKVCWVGYGCGGDYRRFPTRPCAAGRTVCVYAALRGDTGAA